MNRKRKPTAEKAVNIETVRMGCTKNFLYNTYTTRDAAASAIYAVKMPFSTTATAVGPASIIIQLTNTKIYTPQKSFLGVYKPSLRLTYTG